MVEKKLTKKDFLMSILLIVFGFFFIFLVLQSPGCYYLNNCAGMSKILIFLHSYPGIGIFLLFLSVFCLVIGFIGFVIYLGEKK